MTVTTTQPLLTQAAEAPPTSALRPAESARHAWPWVLLALAGLVYMIWAGSSYDPRKLSLWMFKRDDWIALAPGAGHLLIAQALVFAALSVVAWRATRRTGAAGGWLWQAVIIGVIAVIALDVRLAVMRTWLPVTLDPAVIGARAYRPGGGGRGPAILADMLTLGILFLALGLQGKSYWLAALFALHPLAIIESAANGSHISWMGPVLALLALGWRLQHWLRDLVIFGAADPTVLALVARMSRLAVPGGRSGPENCSTSLPTVPPAWIAAFRFSAMT